MKSLKVILFCGTLLTSLNLLANEQKKFYIGLSGGISAPLKSGFDIKMQDTLTKAKGKAKVDLKSSSMGTFELGYKIDPSIAVEFSVDFKPNYDMKINLPFSIGSCKTKANAAVYMLNIVYDLQGSDKLRPYFIAGAGVANLKVKTTKVDVAFGNTKVEGFKLTKNNNINAFAWQVGLGLDYDISDNISVGVSAKIQAVHNIKIKYSKIDSAKSKAAGALKYSHEFAKRTLGVGELTAGIKFRF